MTNASIEIAPIGYHQLVEHAHIFGMEIVIYLYLGGLVAGLLALSGLYRLGNRTPLSGWMQWTPFIAIALISLGMGALFLDLGHKLHVFRFYLAFKPTSPMSWGAWLLILVYPVALLSGLSGLNDQRRTWLAGKAGPAAGLIQKSFALADNIRKPVLILSVIAGGGLGLYTGLLLGTLAAHPLWNSALLGPLFLTSGISTGAALMLLFNLNQDEKHWLVKLDIAALALELALIGTILISFLGSDQSARAAVAVILGGEWTSIFWTFTVVLGLAVPLILELLEVNRKLNFLVWTPALILIGGFSLRLVLLLAGQQPLS